MESNRERIMRRMGGRYHGRQVEAPETLTFIQKITAGIAHLRTIPVPSYPYTSTLHGFTETTTLPRSTKLGHFLKMLDRYPRSTAGMLLFGLCIADGSLAGNPKKKDYSVAPEIYLTYVDKGIDISIPEADKDINYTIHIKDYNDPIAWNFDLLPLHAMNGNDDFVRENRLYQYHADIVHDQYLRTEGVVTNLGAHGRSISETPKADMFEQTGDTSKALRVNKYENESARMPAGVYSTVGEMFGGASEMAEFQANLSFVNREKVSTYFFERGQQILNERGWESFDNLSAQQWALLLDELVNGVPYDMRLVPTDSSYDLKLARRVMKMPLDELLERRNEGWICRDVERMKFGFYLIADEEFHLSDRGLLLIPMAQYSDALHARDGYLIATSETDATLVVTDSTNTSYSRSIQQQDSSSGSAAVWYGQQFGKEWLAPDMARDFYQTALHYFEGEMYPTTRAIAQREIFIATIQLAHASEQSGDAVSAHRQYEEAFDMLSRQLATEAEITKDADSLQNSDRTVPLFDLLIAVAKRADGTDSTQRNYLLALKQFEGYRAHRGMTVAQVTNARSLVRDVDEKDTQQRAAVKEAIRSEISRLEHDLGILPTSAN